MAAPILWAPGKMHSFCRKTCVHKIPRFRRGGNFGLGGGGVPFLFLWARGFFWRKWCPHKARRDSKSPRRTKNSTRIKFTTRSIFSTAGSFGKMSRSFVKFLAAIFGRREKTPTPKTRFSIWTLLRTPGRFTTRPLPVYFATKMSVVRPFSVRSKDEIGP